MRIGNNSHIVRNPSMAAGFLALTLAASLTACSDSSKYVGIWKADCQDHWGVQILPAGGGRYAVTLCGLTGCLPRGDWMPDTPIEGDPNYEVMTSTEMRIRHKGDDSLRYFKCTRDADWPPPGSGGR